MREGSVAQAHEAAPGVAFDAVFEGQHAYVYRLAHALLGHPQDAEDVTQEVFLRVYKALPAYQADRASLRTWLTGIVVNACKTHRRRNFWRRGGPPAPLPEATDESWDLPDPSLWAAPEDQALQAELRRTLRAVLARLRPEHRTVLVLHYYLDLTCPEIARAVGCSEGTVYSRLHYARRRMQADLEQRPAPPGERGRP